MYVVLIHNNEYQPSHPTLVSRIVLYHHMSVLHGLLYYNIIHTYIHTYMQYSIRKKLEGYTEVYIVFIFVYFHVILPYLVTTLLDYILYDTSPAPLYLYMHTCADYVVCVIRLRVFEVGHSLLTVLVLVVCMHPLRRVSLDSVCLRDATTPETES